EAGAMEPAGRADLDYAEGHALLGAGRAPDAVRSFRRAVSEAPRDPEFHYMLGVALDRQGDRAGAAASFRQALDLGLPEADAARARAWLAVPAPSTAARAPRLTVDTQLGLGYDSHYQSGREALFKKSTGT